jgi:hypothetical protein
VKISILSCVVQSLFIVFVCPYYFEMESPFYDVCSYE